MRRRAQRNARLPRHAWTTEDHTILALLLLFYDQNVQNSADLFNWIRRRTLLREGFESGIPARSITAQYWELKHNGKGSKIFDTISRIPSQDVAKTFPRILNIIQRAARSLQFNLEPSTQGRLSFGPTLSSHFNDKVMDSDTTVTTWNPEAQESEFETPTKRNNLQHPKDFLSPMKSPDRGGFLTFRRPRLLYRGLEVRHGLTARGFLHQTGPLLPPPPPVFTSQAFENVVRPHLARDRNYQSPFISFAQSPIVAIKHVFQRTLEQKVMSFAILSHDEIAADAISKYGVGCGPYLVPTICKQYDLCDLPGAYTGTGEFLGWGSVNCKSIAVISSENILTIRAIMRTTTDLNYEAGARLRKYLPHSMGSEHLELFLYQLVKGYKVHNRQKARKSQGYDDFISGAITHRDVPVPTLEAELIEISSDSDEAEAGTPGQHYGVESDWRNDTE